MPRRPKMMKIDDIPRETWVRMGVWVGDDLHDAEVDADDIAESQGPDFMPAMRGLAEWMRNGGPKAKPSNPRGKR